MARIQTPITDLDDLLVTVDNANGDGSGNITVTCTENHGLKYVSEAYTADLEFASTGAGTGTITRTTNGNAFTNFALGDVIVITGSSNDNTTVRVTETPTATVLTVELLDTAVQANFSNDTGENGTLTVADYVTLTNTGAGTYNGRGRISSITSATVFVMTLTGNTSSGAQTGGEVIADNDYGLYYTPEVEIDAPAKKVQLRNSGNLLALGSGVTGQALYSFFKERWKEVEGLTRFDFPMLSITNEQFEFINGYVPADDTTRKMIRTAGWAERDAGNVVRREYSGIITLGTLGDEDQPYFVQEPSVDATIFETDFTGPVNEAVNNYLLVSNSAVDDLSFQGAGTAAETGSVDFNGDSTFTLVDANTISSTLGQFVIGEVIQISGATTAGDNGYYKITNAVDGGAETVYTVEDNEGNPVTFSTAQPDAGEVTITRSAGIFSTSTDLSVFLVGNILTIANSGVSNFNGKTLVTNNSGFNSSTFVELENISTLSDGAAWQVATVTTSLASATVTMDQRTTFKVYVRERGKLYADADLADIGVTTMTYIVYRFPVSNAADLNIQTTADNAIIGANIESITPGSGELTVVTTNVSESGANVLLNATEQRIQVRSAAGGGTGLAKFVDAVDKTIRLSDGGSGTGLLPTNLTDYTVVSVDLGTGADGQANANADSIKVTGGIVGDDENDTATTDAGTGGSYIISEPHGFYAGAPVFLSIGAQTGTPERSAGYSVLALGATTSAPYTFTVTQKAGDTGGTDDFSAVTDGSASARLDYVAAKASSNNTYIALQYLEDIFEGLYIWGDWFANTAGPVSTNKTANTFTAAASTFSSFVVGQYIDVTGNAITAADDTQFKVTAVSEDGSVLTVTNIDGTDASMAVESSQTLSFFTFYTENQVVREANSGKYYRVRVAGRSTVSPENTDAGTFSGGTTEVASDNDGGQGIGPIQWGGSDNQQPPQQGTGPEFTYEGSFNVEGGNTDWSAYTVIVDGNAENDTPTVTKEVIYEYAQWALRQTGSIDIKLLGTLDGGDDDTAGVRIGKIADTLVQFVGSTLETSQGVFVEDINAVDINNILFYDYLNDTHRFPLEVQVTINFNDNLTGDNEAVFYAYYTSLSQAPGTDYDYGNIKAVQVNRIEAGNTTKVGSEIGNDVPNDGVYSFNYAYASDSAEYESGQGGRLPSTDQGITVVAIGLFSGQYVKASGVITDTGLTLSLVAPLERNYTDVD